MWEIQILIISHHVIQQAYDANTQSSLERLAAIKAQQSR